MVSVLDPRNWVLGFVFILSNLAFIIEESGHILLAEISSNGVCFSWDKFKIQNIGYLHGKMLLTNES